MARYSKDRGQRFISIGALGSFGQVPKNNGTGATTGAGDEVAFLDTFSGPGTAIDNVVTWDIVIGGSGGYTSFTINLERSMDGGATWRTVDTSTAITGEIRDVATKKSQLLRANVSAAVVASGAPTITVGIN